METKNFTKLKECLTNGALISTAQCNYLFKILNGGTDDRKQQIKDLLNSSDNGITLAEEQVIKGRDWLLNQWKTPTGAERKNNPFGYREQNALELIDTIRLAGYYDAGNYHFLHYIPIYDVYSTEGYGFQYYVKGGQISIIG